MMSIRQIEDFVGEIDQLYYWAMSYCKMNRCCIKDFIRENRTEVERVITEHLALKQSEAL